MSTQTARKRGHLATPLTDEERRRFTRLYREHAGLVRMMGRRLQGKYTGVRAEDIYSCVDVAFIKACRAWDPAKGRFSTIFGVFCTGEVRHFIRDHNWDMKAPGAVRALGIRGRLMLRSGLPMAYVCEELGVTQEALKLAMFAVQSFDHEIRGFQDHECPRPTPWECVEQAELIGAN